VHSPKATKKCLKWLKRLLKRISKYEGRLGYGDGFEAEFKLNDKEASVDYDKRGHVSYRN
jgi:hypothetical protein